jgi:hypothetical protein
MTARGMAATLLTAVACGGGLVACGVSVEKQKISDSEFVHGCVERLAKNGIVNAHRTDVCKCVQDKLEAQGFGGRESGDASLVDAAKAAGAACAREVLVRQKISDRTFVDICAARVAKNPALKDRRIEVCKCIQARLEAQGFGNRSNADMSFAGKTRAAGAACARKALTGK